MHLMKKDMGGAATVMGLAQMIMALDLPLRLRVLVPAVENSVSGRAMRPRDILTARNGLTVEVNNTDAEGRLILGDTLAYAQEETPDLLISMATLTGSARVAVGPDLAPYLHGRPCHGRGARSGAARGARSGLAACRSGRPTRPLIEPGIADLDNAPSGGMAGSDHCRAVPAPLCRKGALPAFRHLWPPARPTPRPDPRAASVRARGRCWRPCPRCLGSDAWTADSPPPTTAPRWTRCAARSTAPRYVPGEAATRRPPADRSLPGAGWRARPATAAGRCA